MSFDFYLPIYVHWNKYVQVIHHSDRPTKGTKKCQISCMHAIMYVDIDENAQKKNTQLR